MFHKSCGYVLREIANSPAENSDSGNSIQWTTNNPGGSPVHYGIVHYGTDPKDLSQTAQNPIRLNPYHSSTVFRVHLYNLKPRTTYYYKVDSMESNGRGDGVKSAVKKFTTTAPVE